MDGAEADLLITDPPYNVDYTGKTEDALKIEGDSMGDKEFREFLKDCMQCAFDAMRGGASFYVWHSDSEGYNFRGSIQDCGQKVRQCLIWNKNCIVMGRQDYHWKHEPCLVGWKEGAGHTWYADRTQSTVLEFDRPSKSTDHPTMKPVALIAYLMGNSSKAGDSVLDLFMGSGTTMVAAEQLGRKSFGMELSPQYCDVIVKRFEQLTSDKCVVVKPGV